MGVSVLGGHLAESDCIQALAAVPHPVSSFTNCLPPHPRRAPQVPLGGTAGTGPAALSEDHDRLAGAMERLVAAQQELGDTQRGLMQGQQQLAEQQARVVSLMSARGG